MKPTDFQCMIGQFNFSEILSFLNGSDLVSKVERTVIDEISKRGFYKITCQLIPSKYKLDIKFIKTKDEFIYSYQLYTDKSIVRWDNEPHYPSIRTHPHHFHSQGNTVRDSNLTGNAANDIRIVLSKIKSIMKKEKFS